MQTITSDVPATASASGRSVFTSVHAPSSVSGVMLSADIPVKCSARIASDSTPAIWLTACGDGRSARCSASAARVIASSTDPPRKHAGVMHQHDRDADDRAAERGRDPDDAAGRQREADRAAADRDEQRHERERQVELHGRAGIEAEHRDEVRAPDRHAGRNGRQHLPAEPLHAGGVHRALEQARGDPRTGPAQQRGKQDQPVIVPINDAP